MSKVIGVTVGTSISPNSMKSKLDLSQYAKSEWVEETFQQKGNYLAEEQLPEAINTALAQAKASGEFDGKDGYTPQKNVDYFDGADGKTPVKGADYWTNADKQEIVSDVLDQIEIPEGSADVPVFDLVAMGMFALPLPQAYFSIEADTTELMNALSKGSVKFIIPINMYETQINVSVIMQGLSEGATFQCMTLASLDIAYSLIVYVDPGAISVMIIPASTAVGFPAVTAEDNGKFMQVVNGSWAAVALQDVSEVGA